MNQTWSLHSRLLHWSIAVLMIATLILGIMGEELTGPARAAQYMIHGSLGMVLALLAAARLANRMKEGFLPPAGPQAPALDLLATGVHWVLLILPFFMLGTGVALTLSTGEALSLFGLELVAGSGAEDEAMRARLLALHGYGEMAFIIAFLTHVAGALKHHFLDQDSTLRRMIRGA